MTWNTAARRNPSNRRAVAFFFSCHQEAERLLVIDLHFDTFQVADSEDGLGNRAAGFRLLTEIGNVHHLSLKGAALTSRLFRVPVRGPL